MSFKKILNSFLSSTDFLIVFMLTLTQFIIIHFFKIFIKTEAYNDRQTMQFALCSFFISLIFASVVKIHCFYSMGKISKLHDNDSVYSFGLKNLADWMVVEIRVQVRVLIRLFLFIVPGLVEAVRLNLALPFVFYDKRMEDKSFDPVFESLEVLNFKNKHLPALSFITIILPIFLFLASNTDKSFFESNSAMLQGSLSALVVAVGTSMTFAYIVHVYSDLKTNPQINGKGA